MVNVVRQVTNPVHHSNHLTVADSKFESVEVMRKGREEWGMYFVMSQSGKPVCHPEIWKSKQNGYFNHFKTESTRGSYTQVFSKDATFTMVRDSSAFRVVDNCCPVQEEERVVKIWDKTKKYGVDIEK